MFSICWDWSKNEPCGEQYLQKSWTYIIDLQVKIKFS